MYIDDEYFDNEDFKRNLETYEESVKSGAPIFMDMEDLADIMDYYTLHGEAEKAAEVAELTLSIFPEAAPPLIFKSRRALEKEDFAEAERIAEQIEDKTDPDYLYMKAEIQVAQGNVDKADAIFTQNCEAASEDDADDFAIDAASLFSDYLYFELGKKWLTTYKGEETVEYLELVCRCAFGLYELDKAEKTVNRLIDINPYAFKNWNFLSAVQIEKKEYSEALSSSEYSLAICPDNAPGLVSKAKALLGMKNYEEAETYFERYLQQCPDDGDAYCNLGSCQIRTGKMRKAIASLKKALFYLPDDSPLITQINTEIALAYGLLKEPDKAKEYYNNSFLPDPRAGFTDLFRAHALMREEKLEEAFEAFFGVLAKTKGDTNIFKSLLSTIIGYNQFKMAYDFYLKAKPMLTGDCSEYAVLLGICCVETGKYDEYERYMRMAIEHNPGEVAEVMENIIPEGCPVSEYMSHLINYAKKKKKK